ncbi:MAG: hypothetical protein ACT4OI_06535 [Methanobacteriota archaeon]
MAIVKEVESRFVGMIFLLGRVLSQAADGRLRLRVAPDMGYAPRRPRRSSSS